MGILSGKISRGLWLVDSYLIPQRQISAKDGWALDLTAFLHPQPHMGYDGKTGTMTEANPRWSCVLTPRTGLSWVQMRLEQCLRGHPWWLKSRKSCPVVLLRGNINHLWKQMKIKILLQKRIDLCWSPSNVQRFLSEDPKSYTQSKRTQPHNETTSHNLEHSQTVQNTFYFLKFLTAKRSLARGSPFQKSPTKDAPNHPQWEITCR